MHGLHNALRDAWIVSGFIQILAIGEERVIYSHTLAIVIT